MKNWYDDIEDESIEKATGFPQEIPLPDGEGNSIVVVILSEPSTVKGKERDMQVVEASRKFPAPEIALGSLILGKSLRFNIAKALSRAGEDYKKFKLTGSQWRIWATKDKDQKFYQCEQL